MRKNILSIVLIITVFIGSCVKDNTFSNSNDPKDSNDKDTNFGILVSEPSGLAFSANKNDLYTVSDNTGKIYKISFSGNILEELPFSGDDTEGIDVDTNGDIWVVEEGLQYVVHLNSKGELIKKITSIHVTTISSSGFEGIAKNENILYILIEKSPGALIKYNTTSNTWSQINLSFAIDYSGIDYDKTDNTLWIVSHESKTLNHCTLDGVLIKKQEIDVEQAEGVAIDRKNNVAWIVSDQGNKLHRITLKI
jgi:uncharacterized protein YjiK